MSGLQTTILLLILLTAFGGCGYKDWPAPRPGEDAFGFVNVTSSRDGDCILVEADVVGARENMLRVGLQIESLTRSDCPTCPFTPDTLIAMELDDPRILAQEDKLAVGYCGLEPDRLYRWRLVARHVLPSQPVALSRVFP